MSGLKGILAGKRIVVVGGGGLLGTKICEVVVEAGACCLIADVSRQRAEATAALVEAACGTTPPIAEVSIVDRDSVESMLDAAESALGGIDGLVNTAYPRNAAYGRKFEDVTYKDFCENVDLHLGGYFLVAQRVLERFKRNGGGCLLNMSSIYGVIAPRFEIYRGTDMTMPVEYAAIKAAIIHLTKYMAKYYSGYRTRVNCISLGGLYDRQPEDFLDGYRRFCLNKGMLDPDDVAGVIVFMLSDFSKYINGQNLVIDDGFTL